MLLDGWQRFLFVSGRRWRSSGLPKADDQGAVTDFAEFANDEVYWRCTSATPRMGTGSMQGRRRDGCACRSLSVTFENGISLGLPANLTTETLS